MFKSFRYIFLLGLAISFGRPALAQVKLNLSLLPDQQTYLVSVISESTWTAPQNTVGSVQVVLRYNAGKQFIAGNIQSLIPGVTWVDNAYLESPASAPEFHFVSFVLNERGTKNIPFQQDVETPLFTFVNLADDCIGKLELVENESELTKQVVGVDHMNVTQNITVLGARGNAYAGILNASVDCAQATSVENQQPVVKNLRVFPVPTSNVLRVFWENLDTGNGPDKLQVTDILGRELGLERKLISNAAEEQYIQLDVSDFPTGLYNGCFVTPGGDRQSFRFVVAH